MDGEKPPEDGRPDKFEENGLVDKGSALSERSLTSVETVLSSESLEYSNFNDPLVDQDQISSSTSSVLEDSTLNTSSETVEEDEDTETSDSETSVEDTNEFSSVIRNIINDRIQELLDTPDVTNFIQSKLKDSDD